MINIYTANSFSFENFKYKYNRSQEDNSNRSRYKFNSYYGKIIMVKITIMTNTILESRLILI